MKMFIQSSLTIFTSLLAITRADPPNLKACERIKVGQLNEHHASCGNSEFTADCLSKFNAKGLDLACLKLFKFPQDMGDKTVKELSEGDPKQLPLTLPFIRAFLNKHSNWDPSESKKISEHLVGDEEFMVSALGDPTFPKSLLAKIIIADTSAILKPNVCAKFPVDLARALSDTAFSHIEGKSFAAIPPKFFEGISPKFFGNINPKAFQDITVKQVQKIEAKNVVEMKKEQAENWGVEPVLPPIDTNASKADQAEQVKARHAYHESHPCFPAEKWLGNVPSKTKAALVVRCKGFLLSTAAALGASTMTLMLAIMAALVFVV